jgi:hypothetical protein
MRRREMLALAAALVPAAALLFAAGVWVGGRAGGERGERGAPTAAGEATGRAVYSPRVLSDPWFLDRQRENAGALERQCDETGKLCAEARGAGSTSRLNGEQGARPAGYGVHGIGAPHGFGGAEPGSGA